MSRPVSFNPAQPHFGQALDGGLSPSRRQLSRLAEGFLQADQHVDHFFNQTLGLKKMGKGNPLRWVGQLGQWVLGKFGKQDMTVFKTAFGIPIRFAIPTGAAVGSLMVMMYWGLAYARAKRGYDRGLMPNGQRDKREMWDAIRRDVWSISLYIFGIGWAESSFAKLSEKLAGINLFGKGGQSVKTYSDLATNSRLENAKVFAAHLKHGNRDGLLWAAQNNADLGLPKLVRQRNPQLADKLVALIKEFRQVLSPLDKLDTKALNMDRHQTLVTKTSEKAVELLGKMDVLRNSFVESEAKVLAAKQGGAVADHLAKLGKQVPEFRDFFTNYTKLNRSPADLLGFLALLVLIGYAPIWFNRWWTEREYAKYQSQKRHPQPAMDRPANTNPHRPGTVQLQLTSRHLSTPVVEPAFPKTQSLSQQALLTGLSPLPRPVFPSPLQGFQPSLTNVTAWPPTPQNSFPDRFYALSPLK
ncbi:MAG: hypothetical protein KC474_06145 [Cyanobacteria bacterium HKST-UBA04]|nr:hypothetical protein [Cyanobacteria bacterium HKST-UBA04]